MSETELRERVYNLIIFLREEKGMTYEEIEIFWKGCIEEARKQKRIK